MTIFGNPVSQGIVFGNVLVYEQQVYTVVEKYLAEDQVAGAKAAFQEALSRGIGEVDELVRSFGDSKSEQAQILLAHKEILQDEAIMEEVLTAITDDLCSPEYAVETAFNFYIGLLSKAKDPTISARVADLVDVKNTIIRCLRGEQKKDLSQLPSDVIVVAQDLLPSDTASLDRNHVLGFVTEKGGNTSHTAILARSFKLPALVGVSDLMAGIHDGDAVILDALEGKLVINPSEEELAAYEAKRRQYLRREGLIARYLDREPLTKDAVRIDIGVNIGSVDCARDFDHADFCGLFRTEFLYMQSTHLPTEEEQYTAYVSVLRSAGGKPVTLRTLDIGGDKKLPYFQLPEEENPFLGERALRLCFSHPDIFRTQLRAALRASAHGTLWLMFPMVGGLEDFRKAKALVEEVKEELRREQLPFDEAIKIGIMIEIPSIAVIADLAAEEVDFASIGTNDLCQYSLAVDRMNPRLGSYYQSMSPGVIRLLDYAISSFRKAGKPISVCGEMGGIPAAAIALVGMGIRKLSMNSAAVAEIKAALSKVSTEEAELAVKKAMYTSTAAEVEQIFNALVDVPEV